MKNLEKTKRFFDGWSRYHELVRELDTYQFTRMALEGEFFGRVLDVGNGGVFNYDTMAAEEVVLVDIAEDLVKKSDWPPNVRFHRGDATNLPVESNAFDVCLLQLLLHHLAEGNFETTRGRVNQSIRESYRSLKPGGKLIVLESCLPKSWEVAERGLFPLFRAALSVIGHPLVFQWNWGTLATFIRGAGFGELRVSRVPVGRWMIQLGVKWPTALTPARLYKFTAIKPRL